MHAAVSPTTPQAMPKGFYRSIFVIYVRHKIPCLLYKCVYIFLLFMERVHRTYSIGQKRTDPNPNRAFSRRYQLLFPARNTTIGHRLIG